MTYLTKMLLPDERVLCIASLHWVVFLPGLFLALMGGLVGFFCFDLVGVLFDARVSSAMGRVLAVLSTLVSLIGVFLLVGAVVRQSTTELAITNKRIVAKYGFISRTTFEIIISRITGVNFDQSVLGRILGYGTILVHGAGGDISPFDGVSNPQGFHRALMKVLEQGGGKSV